MSNLLGPDRSAVLWYGTKRHSAKPGETTTNTQTRPAVAAVAEQELTIEVWLFGLLSAVTTERPIKLSLPVTATTLDVISVLEERYGTDLLMRVRDAELGMLPCCRVFVDGEPLEDHTAPIAIAGGSAMVEMILVKGFEGG
ncbi:MAG: MoaD/ThiS family protein [Rhodospirillales bacterium]|nr:MoaD/ThiS family protein [Rhodospirillales bacterium]